MRPKLTEQANVSLMAELIPAASLMRCKAAGINSSPLLAFAGKQGGSFKMKISVFSIPAIPQGKHNVKDPRLDEIDNIVKAKKKTYIQVELVGEGAVLEADAILALKDSRVDLVLKDLEFVENRLSNATGESEKALLNKLKGILEKEEFIFSANLSEDEHRGISAYGLITAKPIILLDENESQDLNSLLIKCLTETSCISFFTTTGGKESRAWLINKGTTAWEAAGLVHSDIQKGFIRAEIIGFSDFIHSRGETGARQAGLQRLEQKDYIMQDGDVVNFRFSK